jgi:hypothetical protein
MKIGQVVFNEWHGIRRYGIVTSLREEVDSNCYVPWTYARVKWFGDEPYRAAVESTNKLRNDGSDIQMYEYRVDKLAQISIEKELKVLSDIHHFLRAESIGVRGK